MLALATAANGGQGPSLLLILIGAVIAAVFWRSLVKFSLAFVIILFAVLLVAGLMAFVHGVQVLFP